jgi:hypothetical protein
LGGVGGQDLRSIRAKERGFHLGRDAATDRDLVSAEEMETHAFYKLLARHGLKYFVGGPPEKIIKDFAPNGQPYLFMLAGTIQCFVPPKGGL